MFAGPGNDFLSDNISVAVNEFHCGPGHDTVFADANDVVATDCEDINRFKQGRR